MEYKQFINEFPIVFKKYKVIAKLGIVDFGELYLGKNISTNEQVFIKIAKKDNLPCLLETEAIIMFTLRGKGIPKVISYGKVKNYLILITSLLGPNLNDIYNHNGKKFDIKDISMMAIQILERIEFIHSNYYIHRNIKPDIFYIGKEDRNLIYLTNFSLAKKYRSSRTGNHIKYSNTGKFTGTPRFASSYALKGLEQSRRDDLISLGYMLIYFMKKKLPWQLIKSQNKKEFCVKNYKMKIEIKPEILCYNLPNQILDYIKYVLNLRFEAEPDYNYLKSLFKSMLNPFYLYNENYLFSWIQLNNIPFKFLRNRLSEKKQNGYNSGSENDILNKNSNSLPPAPPVLNKMKKSNSENRFDISGI